MERVPAAAPGARDAGLGVDRPRPRSGPRRRAAPGPGSPRSGSSPGWRPARRRAICVAVELGQPVDGALGAARARRARRTTRGTARGRAAGSRRRGRRPGGRARAARRRPARRRRAGRRRSPRRRPRAPSRSSSVELDRHPVARVELVEPRAGVGREVTAASSSRGWRQTSCGRERAGEPGGAGDEHPARARRRAAAAGQLSHGAPADLGQRRDDRLARARATSSSVRVRSAARNSSRSARLLLPSPTCSPRRGRRPRPSAAARRRPRRTASRTAPAGTSSATTTARS